MLSRSNAPGSVGFSDLLDDLAVYVGGLLVTLCNLNGNYDAARLFRRLEVSVLLYAAALGKNPAQ
jgi:hypothetical protein